MNCNYKVKIKDIQNKYQFKIFCKTYDDTEIQGDIETLNSEVEDLQEENEYLNNLVEQAFDKKEVEGEELTIDDTINAKMEVGLEGNTTQETTTGKQLFDYEDLKDKIQTLTTTGNGKNFTISGSGSYQYLISLTGQKKITGNWNTANLNGHLKVVYEDDTTTNILSSYSSASASGTINLTTDSSKNIKAILIQIYTNSTITIENFMISTSGGEYEPYTNGASPNPSYPSNANKVTGDNTIVVSNKNLFIGNDIHSGFVVATIGNPVTYRTSSLTETYQKCCYVKAGQQYTLSRNVNTPASTNLRTSVVCDDNDIILERIDFNSTSNSIIFTPTKTGWLYLTSDINATNIQIEDGTATPYEEHQEQTFQINLGNIEVCGIGDYRDYFYKSKSNNKWYLHKQIGKVVLDGSENFISAGTSGTDYRYNKTLSSLNIPNATTNNALCMANYFQNVTIKTDKKWGAFYINGNWLVFYDKDNNFENATAFNTWLSTHNTLIYYVLATPTDTEITDTTLISQLEALKTAMSYAGQTNISQINNDAPFILQVTALASYNSRIVALENAILNANRNVAVENSLRKVSSNEVIEEPKEEVVDDNKDKNIIKEEK